jgi:adenine-specific DNA-methyltransferase
MKRSAAEKRQRKTASPVVTPADRERALVAAVSAVSLSTNAKLAAAAASGVWGAGKALVATANSASVDAARAVTHAAALEWWRAKASHDGTPRLASPTPPPPLTLPSLPPAVLAEAEGFGASLAALTVEDASAALGRLYTAALPAEHRAHHGIYYTPSPLVSRLLDRAEAAGHDWRTGRACDPSCGGGAFVVAAAARMVRALDGAEPAIVLASLSSRLRGWDLDPFAVWLTNLAVEVLVLPLVVASGRRLAPVAEVRDALGPFEDVAGTFDLVMGNPPFGKVKDTPAIRARFKRSLHGHPNLYGLFTDLAVHLAKPAGGIIAYLTPASFLAGHYFKALRGLLHKQARPVGLELVESRKDVFADVLQEVALSVFRRGRRASTAACAVVHAERDGLTVQPTGSLVLPADPEAPWTFPRSADDAALVAHLRQLPSRLRDWGYGVSTGPLVWNRHKASLHDDPAPGRVPVVWAEAVTQDGRFVLKATKRTHRPWFTPRGPDDPNLVRRACVLVQRTTAKEQHRRLICAAMPAEVFKTHGTVTVENHLNMILPRDAAPKVPVATVAAFLSTTTADRVLRCINASVAVSASELEAMPLPAAKDVVKAMASADPEAAVRRLYGLPA